MPEKPVPRVPIPLCALQLLEVGSHARCRPPSAPCTTDDWRLCSPKLSRTRSSVWTHVRGAYVAASAACTSQNGSRQSAISPVTVYRLPSATKAKTTNARWRGKHSKGVMTHDCIAAIPLSLSRQGCETSQCHGSGETVSEARLARKKKGPAASVGERTPVHLRGAEGPLVYGNSTSRLSP